MLQTRRDSDAPENAMNDVRAKAQTVIKRGYELLQTANSWYVDYNTPQLKRRSNGKKKKKPSRHCIQHLRYAEQLPASRRPIFYPPHFNKHYIVRFVRTLFPSLICLTAPFAQPKRKKSLLSTAEDCAGSGGRGAVAFDQGDARKLGEVLRRSFFCPAEKEESGELEPQFDLWGMGCV